MDVFEFRKQLVKDYERFTRSFCTIRAKDIQEFSDKAYTEGHFWPDPLIQLNPGFVSDMTVEDLVRQKVLHPLCSAIFRLDKHSDGSGLPLPLYKHQEEALTPALKGKSYVVATGTGSGKSLSYFIPIVDAILKKREKQPQSSISAIVVYPMNALCNSQMEELRKFLETGFEKNKAPVTFARYTGQESSIERDSISKTPPDILLTNFMMLEYLMTRQKADDQAIVRASEGLQFLVLDELHSYRGRQGADVAMLVRRVRERFNPNLQIIGTSATMASEGSTRSRKSIVAEVATRFFGTPVEPENVITETLKRRTPGEGLIDLQGLTDSLKNRWPSSSSFEFLRAMPLARWIEENLGLEKEDETWVRAKPKSIKDAASLLAQTTGQDETICREAIRRFLMDSYAVCDRENRSLFAFRLHQFLSGAGSLYTTLEPEGDRWLTLEGQLYKPDDRSKRLFEVVFCRECGQEYLPIWASWDEGKLLSIESREIWDRTSETDGQKHGYFMPDEQNRWSPDRDESFPESWLVRQGAEAIVLPSLRKSVPRPVTVDSEGKSDSEGLAGWLIPGSFRFCLNRPECGASFEGSSDFSKLSPLSSEGRSSATSILALSALLTMKKEKDLPPNARKILGFTDNRQDAALQAGHFNDLVQILLIRGSLLGALQGAGDEGLSDEVLTQKVFPKLALDPQEFMSNPLAQYQAKISAEKAMRDVLGYRLMFDLQRGWRFNNPNLEQLELLQIEIPVLAEVSRDEALWKEGHSLFASIPPTTRLEMAREILDYMRRELCIKSIFLDSIRQEQIVQASFSHLKEPWGLSPDEKKLKPGKFLLLGTREEKDQAYISGRSRIGRKLKKRLREFSGGSPFDENVFMEVLKGFFTVLAKSGIVEQEIISGKPGYRVVSAALVWTLKKESGNGDSGRGNRFFRELYLNIANILSSGSTLLSGIRAGEHTAQVSSADREKREEEFREGTLPVLFCSPTMELGVDIAQLNTVYLRNIPPTPSNYAQRSGRSGRSGQPSIVIAYCAARSPHDQYFFKNPEKMVSGVVDPPVLDLSNEELVLSHLHSVWLSETGQKLSESIAGILERAEPNLPLLPELVQTMTMESVVRKAHMRGQRILGALADDLTPERAPWFSSEWLDRVMRRTFLDFDGALDRWRSLFLSTQSQMNRSHAVTTNPAASKKDREEAKSRYDEANSQMGILLAGTDALNSDFYTYRYLANQGFLPGYNFPRLPLLAYIPGKRERAGQDVFLARPRFLALSEFGPNSLIYHEGSHYRVHKVILGLREEAASGKNDLTLHRLRICPACGYAHFDHEIEVERCVSCGDLLSGGRLLTNLYRIENVSTYRVDRITSDEEERQRQGFELITTFQFSRSDKRENLIRTEIFDDAGEILSLKFSHSSRISRLNLGRRRRKDPEICGFPIDLRSGKWKKNEDEPDPNQDDVNESDQKFQRIIPYVEDRKNLLVMSVGSDLREALGDEGMTSLQYALKRGIETSFQLEESELSAEPLPNPRTRTSFLFYESAEGGAGVLQQLLIDPAMLQKSARAALEVIHCDPEGKDTNDQESRECEAGCYRCLLSYYNQPDHGKIDRKNQIMIQLLVRLSKGHFRTATGGQTPGEQLEKLLNAAGSNLEKDWLLSINEKGYRLPDQAQPLLLEFETRPDFLYERTQSLIYIDGPHHDSAGRKMADDRLTRLLEDAGYTVIRFGKGMSLWPAILSQYPDVFGTGGTSSSGREK